MGGKAKDPNYQKHYYQRHRDKLIAMERARYQVKRNLPGFREARKREREERYFGLPRWQIFRRSGGKCVDCGRTATVVHHLDGDGRTNEKRGLPPGTNSDRMVGLCRACHLSRHRPELLAARKAVMRNRWARHFDACVDCGTTQQRHGAHGRCKRCYARLLYRKRKSRACGL